MRAFSTPIAPGRVEIDIGADRRKRDEQDLVGELHIVDAGLPGELAETPAQPALDVARRLGFQVEIDRKRVDADTFIDIRCAKAARDAAEDCQHRREAVLEAEVERVVCFGLIERCCLGVKRRKCARRRRVETVMGGEPHLLEPPAPRDVGRRQDGKCLLRIDRRRLLTKIVGMKWRIGQRRRYVWPQVRNCNSRCRR